MAPRYTGMRWWLVLVIVVTCACSRVERGESKADTPARTPVAKSVRCEPLNARGRTPSLAEDRGGTLYAGWVDGAQIRVSASSGDGCWRNLGSPHDAATDPVDEQLARGTAFDLEGGPAGEVAAMWVTQGRGLRAARYDGDAWQALEVSPRAHAVGLAWAGRWLRIELIDVQSRLTMEVATLSSGLWKAVTSETLGFNWTSVMHVAVSGERVAIAAAVCSDAKDSVCQLQVRLLDGDVLHQPLAPRAFDDFSRVALGLAPGDQGPSVMVGGVHADSGALWSDRTRPWILLPSRGLPECHRVPLAITGAPHRAVMACHREDGIEAHVMSADHDSWRAISPALAFPALQLDDGSSQINAAALFGRAGAWVFTFRAGVGRIELFANAGTQWLERSARSP